LSLNIFRLCLWVLNTSRFYSIKDVIFNLVRINSNRLFSNDFVNMFASWFSESMNWIITSPFWTWSLIKWCWISICFALECIIGFFVRFMALVLSHLILVHDSSIPKSLSCCRIHKIWEQQLPRATYFSSAVERATVLCFLENYDTNLLPSIWYVLEVLFLSTLQHAKSTFEYPMSIRSLSFGYHSPSFGVVAMYLMMRFVAIMWDSLGFDWNLAQMQTLNKISCLDAVR